MKAAAILIPLALAACSKPTVSAENASVAEVQEKIKEAGGQQVFLSPGRWESTMNISKVDIPGLPPEIAARMQKAMAAKTSASCLTPEEAKKPAAEFFAGKERKDCRYDHFQMGEGALDAKMTCGGEGAAATIAMKGTYGPDKFDLAMNVDGNGMTGAPQGKMSMAMNVASRRTGACTGKEAS